MKRWFWFGMVFLFTLLVTSDGSAGGPWDTTIRGNGRINFGSPTASGVTSVRLNWNIKTNATNEINGHLHIVEDLVDGGRRTFRVSSDQFETPGNPQGDDFQTDFTCGPGDPSVELVGNDAEGHRINFMINEELNAIFYEVFVPFQETVSSAGSPAAPLPLDGHIVLDCAGQATGPDLPDNQPQTANSGSIYLPLVLRVPPN